MYDLNDNSSLSEVFDFCDKSYKKNSSFFLKIIFFFLDKDQGKNQIYLFSNCMLWLYLNNENDFYRLLSVIVGIHNDKILSDNKIKIIFKDEYDKFNLKLNEFVSPDYQESFKLNWFSNVRNNVYIPCYGDWEVLIIISEKIKEYCLWTDELFIKNKVFHVIINLFINQIKIDKQYKKNSGCVKHIKNVYKKYINICTKDIEKYPIFKKEIKFLNFQERYQFIF